VAEAAAGVNSDLHPTAMPTQRSWLPPPPAEQQATLERTSRRPPWLARWLAANADLADLHASNPRSTRSSTRSTAAGSASETAGWSGEAAQPGPADAPAPRQQAACTSGTRQGVAVVLAEKTTDIGSRRVLPRPLLRHQGPGPARSALAGQVWPGSAGIGMAGVRSSANARAECTWWVTTSSRIQVVWPGPTSARAVPTCGSGS